MLSQVPDRRHIMVVGAPGIGKSTALREWLGAEPATWYSGQLPDAPAGTTWLVVDDLATLDVAAITAWLNRLPATTRVALLARTPWPGRPPADIAVLTAADLVLSGPRAVQLLADEYGLGDAGLATEVYELTGGWPSLLRLAGRHLQTGSLATLCAPGMPLDAYVAGHVLPYLTGPVRRLLRQLALDPGVLGPRDRDTLRQLAELGLVVANRPVPVLATLIERHWPIAEPTRRRMLHSAADAYVRHGLWGPAVRAALRAGDLPRVTDLLREHGGAILATGGADLVVEACAALDDPELTLLYGEALCVTGRLDESLAQLTPLLAGRDGPIEAALAWRLGVVHYLRAEHREAFDVLTRGRIDGAATTDEALLLAWTATVHWSVGNVGSCRGYAERALAAAQRAGDDQAIAVAHVALALHAVLAGDRPGNAQHYAKALTHAEAAGDAVQVARIRANRVSQLLEEARYLEALAESEVAVAAAEAVGHATILGIALVNRAEALLRLGELDESERCGERALAISQRAGSRKVSYALVTLGDVRARRGQRSLARAAYEEAARAADADGLLQCLVPALAGLAQVLAADDPAAGRQYADRAIARASGPLATRALLASGWVAVAAGDSGGAAEAADRAEESARRHRDRAGLAEALELRASATDRVATRRVALREAERTWRSTGARLDADRVACLLGQLPGATTEDRLAGCLGRVTLDAAGLALPADEVPAPRLAIRALGRFEVYLDDQPLPASAWQSRKARDLLRILVARRGRRVAREELAALLWPDDDDVQRVAHRLSVALSTLRGVLDPDRRLSPDHYVNATPSAIAVESGHVDIDLETFLSEAEAGRGLVEAGQATPARVVLGRAERRYTGDVFEDEPYDDWSVPAREETRAVYLHVARTLATLAAGRGATDEAIGYLLRILARDPYDEQCHRDLVDLLVAAGRHGEAARARARYAAAMREIGLPQPA